MLKQLSEIRYVLDEVMCDCVGKRIVLYGNGRTGRFLKWYAKYYHNIDIAYTIRIDDHPGRSYEQELYGPMLFKFGYQDVSNAIIWVSEIMDDELKAYFYSYGYSDHAIIDFYKIVYKGDYFSELEDTDRIHKRKTGKRDIQLIEYLEWKYGCNFVESIYKDSFRDNNPNAMHGAPYMCTSQPEIFPLLDQCRQLITPSDAAFDFGCGKGATMVSFLDYGFEIVGGVEYESGIYDVLEQNIEQLGLRDCYEVNNYNCDATLLKEELDRYNYFYFFHPFDEVIYKKCIDNICNSLKRRNRKIHILAVYPIAWKYILDTGMFRIKAQMSIDMRQRCAYIYENRDAVN